MIRHRGEAVTNLVIILSALVAAVAISWWAHSAVNFGYPVLYDALGIDAHIAEYGPQNRHRDGFESTSRAKRLALFDRLVAAINRGGEGLQELTYRPSPQADAVPFLRHAEIHHLTAVAVLVTALHWGGVAGLVAFSASLAVMRYYRWRLWRSAPLVGLGIVTLLAVVAAVAALDTRDNGWFAWAHDQLFGPGHQWFFYYQESLMTTLLKAPDLFAPLGVSLGLVAILAASLLYALTRWLLPVTHR